MEQTFLNLFGSNPDDREEIRELQKDMIHLRNWRVTMEQVQRRSFWGVLSFLGAAIIAAFVMGLQATVRGWTSGG